MASDIAEVFDLIDKKASISAQSQERGTSHEEGDHHSDTVNNSCSTAECGNTSMTGSVSDRHEDNAPLTGNHSALGHVSTCSCGKDVKLLNNDIKALVQALGSIQQQQQAQVQSTREGNAYLEKSMNVTKRELTLMFQQEISKLKETHKSELEQVNQNLQSCIERIQEGGAAQETVLQTISGQVKDLQLRVDLMDCSSPAFVKFSNISSVSETSPTESPSFFSCPCGHRMNLSLFKDQRGNIIVVLNIEKGDYDSLVEWPLVGRVIVEVLGYSVKEEDKKVHRVIGKIDLDHKSGTPGGGGYIGQISSEILTTREEVLKMCQVEEKKWMKSKAPVNPICYVRQNSLFFRIITHLKTPQV